MGMTKEAGETVSPGQGDGGGGPVPALEGGAVEPPRSSAIWRLTRMVAGWLLIALGLVGLVLPILQGVVLLALGLSLLAVDSPWARRLLDRLKEKISRRRHRDSSGGSGGS